MRTRALATVVGLIAVCLILCLLAGPTSAAASTFHIRSAGKGADAAWTTCPTEPVPDTICTFTHISMAEEMTRDDGTKYPSTTMAFGQSSYRVDGEGNITVVSDSYGYGDAIVSFGKKLTSATASATIPLIVCTVEEGGNYDCQEGIATVSAAWTGEGDLVRSGSNYRTVSAGYTMSSHYRGLYRDAVASAQVNGSDVAGSPQNASLYDSRWMEISIYRGG